MRAVVLFLVFLWSMAGIGSAADYSYIDYLSKTGLDAEECVKHSPSELFRIVMEREKLGFRGTPSHEASTVAIFYKHYLGALLPLNDTKPELTKSRQELRELFYYLADAFGEATGERSYITEVTRWRGVRNG